MTEPQVNLPFPTTELRPAEESLTLAARRVREEIKSLLRYYDAETARKRLITATATNKITLKCGVMTRIQRKYRNEHKHV